MKTKNQVSLSASIVIVCMVLLGTVSPTLAQNSDGDEEKVFVIHAPIRDLDDYRILAEQAARLKPFGRVEMNISTLADKGFHDGSLLAARLWPAPRSLRPARRGYGTCEETTTRARLLWCRVESALACRCEPGTRSIRWCR